MRKSEEQRIQGEEIVKNKLTDCALTNAVGHFSLIKTEEIIRSLSYKNPFCAIVKGLRLFKASEEQIPTAMSEETTKSVNYHKNGNLPLFCIEKDTCVGVLYAPFACVLMQITSKKERLFKPKRGRRPRGFEPQTYKTLEWAAENY